jgi:hypothetical protein
MKMQAKEHKPMPHVPSLLAKQLGYAGLVPFVMLATLLWTVKADFLGIVITALMGYCAVIASFLGGVHWGMARQLPARNANLNYVWGVTPSLLGWMGVMMPAFVGLPLLGLTLAACYWVDRSTYPSAGWAMWLPMRLHLTVVSVLSCMLGAAAVYLKHHA